MLKLFPAAVLIGAAAAQVSAADLKQETKDAFAKYRATAEQRINGELEQSHKTTVGFMHFERLPEAERARVRGLLQRGDVVIDRVASDEQAHIPGGLIHDWLATAFIPGASLDQVLRLAQDYDHHQQFFGPEVERSKLISRSMSDGGDDFSIFYRLRRKKIVTVVLDTEHDVRYMRFDAAHAFSRSYSTAVHEIADAGSANEHELPPDKSHGFLWELDSYWRFERGDGGVYVQCEAISLTRDVPAGFGWLVGPFVQSIPRESLTATLVNQRRAVQAMKGSQTD
jgi:hypothetical protein